MIVAKTKTEDPVDFEKDLGDEEAMEIFEDLKKDSIKKSLCFFCGGPAVVFDDDEAIEEYRESGLCMSCQKESPKGRR